MGNGEERRVEEAIDIAAGMVNSCKCRNMSRSGIGCRWSIGRFAAGR
jgi:hypothetical protein